MQSEKGHMTQSTGTRDVEYNLVSILYHALQGAETYQMYIHDAEQGGDREFVDFFRQCFEEEKRRATQARQLLERHFSETMGQRKAA